MLEIEIYDMKGNLFKQTSEYISDVQSVVSLPLSGISQGIYLLKLNGKGWVHYNKLFVK